MANPSVVPQDRMPAVLEAFKPDMDADQLRTLLSDPSMASEAVAYVKDPTRKIVPKVRAVYVMLEAAAGAGRPDLVAQLFAFARDSSVPTRDLVNRHSLIAAIKSERVDVMAEFVAVEPESVNFSFGISGDSLSQAVCGPSGAARHNTSPEARISLVKYLLEEGANPNAHACQFTRPGFHLYSAIERQKPLEMVRLLLDHGAQIAGSGAVVAAAEAGRLDVLYLLQERGADLNEPLGDNIIYSREYGEERAKERPLDAARRKGQESVVTWLLNNGAQ